jgi:hypothetical protein
MSGTGGAGRKLPGPVDEWEEDLPLDALDGAHGFLHLGVAALASLLADPFVDPFGRVPLFPGNVTVRLDDPGDPVKIRPDLRLLIGLRPPVTRRRAVRQDLLQRLPGKPRLPLSLALAFALHENIATNPRPLLHVREHPSPPESQPSRLCISGQYLGVLTFSSDPPSALLLHRRLQVDD